MILYRHDASFWTHPRKHCEHTLSSKRRRVFWKDGSNDGARRIGGSREVNGVFFDKPSSYYNCFSSKVTITHETERLHYPLDKGNGGFYLLFCCFFLLSLPISGYIRLLLPLGGGLFFFLLPFFSPFLGARRDFHKTRRAKSVLAVFATGWNNVLNFFLFFLCSSRLSS